MEKGEIKEKQYGEVEEEGKLNVATEWRRKRKERGKH